MSDVGGSVTSRDGQLVVAVPAGATATPVEITVTEISNTAPDGVGKAYRLGPEGTRFAAPVALIFRAAADAALSDFTVATQDPTGYWVRVPNVRRDEAAHTIVATTTHFSDWVLVLAPSDRDLSGVFRIASTRDGVVANGVTRFFFESGDASSTFYLQSGRITVETPISRPTATCQPDAATKNVGPNIGEIHSNPSRFVWGATGIWDLTCTPTGGGTAARDFASVVFENLGLNYPRCTRSYLTPPVVGIEDVQGSYEINCGAEGTITADWHFQKCVPGAVCQTANVCKTAAINCDAGLPLCVENGNVTNGTSCGTNAVCGDGVCNPCTVGEACTPTNNCHTGGITCDTGFQVCTDTGTSLANGTVCGTNQVCFTGTCVACTAGNACATNPNSCVAGTTSCATGQETCVDTATNIPNGTVCVIAATPTVPAVCNGGACNACAAGLACPNPPNPCKVGTTSCATGVSACVDTAANVANGTTCDVNPAVPEVCNNGVCSACAAGVACATNPNECFAGVTSCATGTSVCEDNTAAPDPVATSCAGGVCNGTGGCNACIAGNTCATNSNECFAGVTSCATGAQTCENNTAAPDPVTTACTGGVCNGAGVCNACVAGNACSTNTNECYAGVTSCATGAQTCENDTSSPDPVTTACTGGVCNGAGVCNACTSGLACTTNVNECFAGMTSCASGAQTCENNIAAPDPVATPCTGGVCNGSGACNVCAAGNPCSTNANECFAGVTSCASGAQTCENDTTAPDLAATPCTGGVCSGDGACNACTAGVSCSTNPNECFAGVTSCATGAQTCVDDTAAPDPAATPCADGGGVCNGSGVCNSCTPGLPCSTNSSECFAGITSCATGTQVCVDDPTAPDLAATPCTGGVCDGAGICNACTSGGSCSTNPNECFAGVTSCATGTQTCENDTAAPDPAATACAGGVCNGAGVCNACTAGLSCSSNLNECFAGTTSCASGAQTCENNTAAPDPVATPCAGGVCNGAGVCSACTAGTPCSTNPNECFAGQTSCATGTEVCVDNTAAPDPIATACAGGVCNGTGVCSACTAGSTCSTNPNECYAGVTSCTTGMQTCENNTAAPDPVTTPCAGGVCNGAGTCNTCVAGNVCTTNPNECFAGVTSCATGTQTCENNTAAPDPAATACAGGVCNGTGVCTACTAGAPCTTNPDECFAGTTSCASGTPTCLNNTASPDPVATACAGGVCDGAGVCNACTAGTPCSTNPNECFAGTITCATGSQSCVDDTAAPDPAATACTGGSCNGAGVCVLNRTITGTRLVTRWTTAGAGCSIAGPCSTTAPAPDVLTAIVEAIGTDGTRYAGTISGTGDFSIPNVPPGPYTLAFSSGGVTQFIQTSSSTVDLGFDVLGRAATLATSPTPVNISVSGLSNWIASDEVQISAPDVDLWNAPISGDEIPPDQVNGSVVEDWSSSSIGRALNLLTVTDVVWVHQLSTSTVTDGTTAYAYQAATRSAQTAALADMTDGASVSLGPATLQPVVQTGNVVIDWRTSEFEASLGSMGPGAQPAANAHALIVRTLPYAVSSPSPAGTGAPELFRLLQPGGAANVNLSALDPPIVYGRFLDTTLWSEWRDASFTASVSYTAPQATVAVPVPVRISRREPMLPAPPSPIVPQVGTVQSPLVNGLNALGALGAVGPSPTLAWAAPLAGVPSSYRVTIRELLASGTASTTRVVATLTTTGLSVTVPAGALTAGRTYFAEITARVRSPESFATAPNRQTAAGSDASTLTSTFTP